jgi:hypothetical protein
MPVSYQAALLLAMKIEYHFPPFFAIATRAVDFFVFHSIQALYINHHLLSNLETFTSCESFKSPKHLPFLCLLSFMRTLVIILPDAINQPKVRLGFWHTSK